MSSWLPSVESVLAGQYEQYCKDNNDCSQLQGLTCQTNRCKCAPGGETVFSISKNRCVGAAGIMIISFIHEKNYPISISIFVLS